MSNIDPPYDMHAILLVNAYSSLYMPYAMLILLFYY